MTVELFHDLSPRKYGTGPGSNSPTLDLQSDSHLLPDRLPTALCGPVTLLCKIEKYIIEQRHENSNNVVCATSKSTDQSLC